MKLIIAIPSALSLCLLLAGCPDYQAKHAPAPVKPRPGLSHIAPKPNPYPTKFRKPNVS